MNSFYTEFGLDPNSFSEFLRSFLIRSFQKLSFLLLLLPLTLSSSKSEDFYVWRHYAGCKVTVISVMKPTRTIVSTVRATCIQAPDPVLGSEKAF